VSEPHRQDDLHPFEAEQRQRRTLLGIIRLVFVVILATVTLLTIYQGESGGWAMLIDRWSITLLALAAVFGTVAIAIDILTPEKKIATLFSILFGLLGALLVTSVIGFVIDVLAESYEFGQATQLITPVKLLIGICLAYLGITTVLQTKDDFRLAIPYVEFAKQIRGVRPFVLDTSSLIDARIVDLGRTGVIQSPIVIPQFVITELQSLSDSVDKLKRARGRRGLEMVQKLQREPGLDVTIDEKPVPGKSVDQMVIELAREMQGAVVTADVGLARVAAIRNVAVLNLNDVANALKAMLVPGERVRVTLVRPGEHDGQAVGYLEDGTMVVAEGASGRIGETAELVVTSSLQTSAGRMIFAKSENGEPRPAEPTPPEPVTPPGAEPADERAPTPVRGARPRRGRNPRR